MHTHSITHSLARSHTHTRTRAHTHTRTHVFAPHLDVQHLWDDGDEQYGSGARHYGREHFEDGLRECNDVRVRAVRPQVHDVSEAWGERGERGGEEQRGQGE